MLYWTKCSEKLNLLSINPSKDPWAFMISQLWDTNLSFFFPKDFSFLYLGFENLRVGLKGIMNTLTSSIGCVQLKMNFWKTLKDEYMLACAKCVKTIVTYIYLHIYIYIPKDTPHKRHLVKYYDLSKLCGCL